MICLTRLTPCVALLMALAAAPVVAQQSGGGIILLPDSDTLTLQGQGPELPTLSEDRYDPARRGFDADSYHGFTNWVTPLRLTDLQIRRSGTTARVMGERQVVNFDLKAYPFESGGSIYCVTQGSVRSRNSCAAHVERATWLGM
jgi:hypothetical protein